MIDFRVHLFEYNFLIAVVFLITTLSAVFAYKYISILHFLIEIIAISYLHVSLFTNIFLFLSDYLSTK